MIDARPATLVTFSWHNNGYDSPALVEGHAANLREALEMWLGDAVIEELSFNHPYHALSEG